MSVTSTSPGCTRSISRRPSTTRTGPQPIFWPIARPSTSTLPVPFELVALLDLPRPALFTVSGRACRM